MSQVWLAIGLTYIHQFLQFLAYVFSRDWKIGCRYNFLKYLAFTYFIMLWSELTHCPRHCYTCSHFLNLCWWHVPKIVKIGGCVLKLYPVKLGTFFWDTLYSYLKHSTLPSTATCILHLVSLVSRICTVDEFALFRNCKTDRATYIVCLSVCLSHSYWHLSETTVECWWSVLGDSAVSCSRTSCVQQHFTYHICRIRFIVKILKFN